MHGMFDLRSAIQLSSHQSWVEELRQEKLREIVQLLYQILKFLAWSPLNFPFSTFTVVAYFDEIWGFSSDNKSESDSIGLEQSGNIFFCLVTTWMTKMHNMYVNDCLILSRGWAH